MTALSNQIIEQVKELPKLDQVEIVDKLLDLIEPVDESIEKAWEKEASDRLEAYRNDEIKTTSLERIIKKYS